MEAPRPDPLVVAIDGPAGSGKSTVARQLARELGWAYLDTGAMYRAVTLEALQRGIPPADAGRVAEIATSSVIHLDPTTGQVTIGGKDVTGAIRTPRVNAAVSQVAAIPAVREVMVGHQRRFARDNGRIVAEGRDIGTVVFPNAVLKAYLDASVEERARRRVEEMRAKDPGLDAESVRRAIVERDRRDTERDVAPLRKDPGAVAIDTTGLTPRQVVDRLLALVKSRVPPVAAR